MVNRMLAHEFSDARMRAGNGGRVRERAFSLIEVIIALTILSIVLSGAAVAVVSSDSAEGRAKAVADTHAMGEKAVERLRTDLTAQSACDAGGWITTARKKKLSGQTTVTNFSPCQVDYNDMRDSKGRSYLISLIVRARDNNQDGFGAADSDGDLRDTYDVQTTVTHAANSRAGRETVPVVRLGGTVDWEGGSTDDATITVIACAIDRPDRALVAGGCSTGDPSRRPVTVTVTAYRVNEQTGGTSSAGTITSGGTPTALRPGAYRFTAPSSITSGGATFNLFKLDPADLRVAGSQAYTLQATYVRRSMTTTVCTQINNYNGPHDDGYEVLRTNLHVRRANQAGSRTNRIIMNSNRSWNCTAVPIPKDPKPRERPGPDHTLSDPIDGTNLYRGVYDIEIDQVNRAISSTVFNLYRGLPAGTFKYSGQIASLRVSGAKLNCSLPAWNRTLDGTALYSRGSAGALERPPTPSTTSAKLTTTFKARMSITANTGGQRLCLRFNSKQLDRQKCAEGSPGCVYKTCALPKYHKGIAVVDNDTNCWNGAEVCVSNCGSGGSAPAGTAGSVSYTTNDGYTTGGPNDGTVACRPGTGYVWPGSKHYAWSMSTNVPMGTITSYDWVGGDAHYYANFSGRTSAYKGHPYGTHPDAYTYNLPDHPVYNCQKSYWSAGSWLIKNKYPYYTCLEVYIPGREHIKVRGRVLDVSGSGDGLYASVGASLALAPDASRNVNHWNPFGNGSTGFPDVVAGGNWPDYKVAVVSGDPVCDSGSAPVFEHVDPIITYWRIYNDARIHNLNPQPVLSRLGTDLLGV